MHDQAAQERAKPDQVLLVQFDNVVVDGLMYVTAANEVWALDARTGREVWHYAEARTPGLVGDPAAGINRGVAVLGDRVFLQTDHAHLVALDRLTGQRIWDVEMADYRQHFHPSFAMLTGSEAEIAAAAKAYRVYYARAGGAEDENYLMDHSSFVYLMDGEGRYIGHFGPDVGPGGGRGGWS